MNKRIKELRQQATLVETYTSHDGSIHEGKNVDLEKFAELIVAECIEVFSKDLPEIDDKNFNILDLTNRICNVAEHFGVEE